VLYKHLYGGVAASVGCEGSLACIMARELAVKRGTRDEHMQRNRVKCTEIESDAEESSQQRARGEGGQREAGVGGVCVVVSALTGGSAAVVVERLW